ncbi:rod shape-determining protein MreD [Clostridium hydrogeniformans]|uniref:rod shape-determining protein MreD n=1 Tax=Clostridium hydrogeniformans TaxID=349933 RepID=UPI00048A04AE|nr:rod shape-determining protein MreD [Clostridium hydrogeniformans]
MRRFILALICIGLLVLDNTVMPFLSFRGAYGSLLFSFAICYSIVVDEWEALFIGLLSGILQDIYMFKGFGINSLVNMILCIATCKIGTNIFKEKSFIPVITNFFMSMLKGIMVFLILYVLKQNTDLQTVAIGSVYSLIMAMIMYKRVFKLSQKPYMKKDWNF